MSAIETKELNKNYEERDRIVFGDIIDWANDPNAWGGTLAFNTLTGLERDDLCLTEDLSEEFVSDHWDDMTLWQQVLCCQFQTLPLTFIRSKWWQMEERHKVVCCYYQDLDEGFIRQYWSGMGKHAQAACCESQELSIDLIYELWGAMTNFAKITYITFHTEKFKNSITPACLPQFLTDPLNTIRELAKECIGGK